MLELERLNLNSDYSGSINNKLYYWSKLFNFFEPHVYHMNANISPVFDFLHSFYYWLKICPSYSYVETHSLIVMILRGMTFEKDFTLLKHPPANVGDKRDTVLILESGRSLEKDMATHSSIHGLRIPSTQEPGGLQSIGLQRAGHDWSDLVHLGGN